MFVFVSIQGQSFDTHWALIPHWTWVCILSCSALPFRRIHTSSCTVLWVPILCSISLSHTHPEPCRHFLSLLHFHSLSFLLLTPLVSFSICSPALILSPRSVNAHLVTLTSKSWGDENYITVCMSETAQCTGRYTYTPCTSIFGHVPTCMSCLFMWLLSCVAILFGYQRLLSAIRENSISMVLCYQWA